MHTSTLEQSARVSLPPASLVLAAALVGALVWTYWLIIPGLVAQWWDEPEYSHAFLIPIVSGALAWSRRDELARLSIRPGYWGLAVMAFALVVYVTGKVGADLFLQRLSLVMMTHLLLLELRVERHHDGAGLEDREVGDAPLRTVLDWRPTREPRPTPRSSSSTRTACTARANSA